MLNSNDYLTGILAERREVEHRKKAQNARLLLGTRTGKSGFRERLLSRCGEFLIIIGQKLQARYEPQFGSRLAFQHLSDKEAAHAILAGPFGRDGRRGDTD